MCEPEKSGIDIDIGRAICPGLSLAILEKFSLRCLPSVWIQLWLLQFFMLYSHYNLKSAANKKDLDVCVL